MNDVCEAALLAASGAGNAFDRALAEAGRILGDLLLDRIGRERRQHSAAARQNAEDGAQQRAADDRLPGVLEFGWRRPQIAEPRRNRIAMLFGYFKVLDDFDDTEHADDHRQEVEAVPQHRNAERVARRTAVDVGADKAEQKADQNHADGFDDRAMREHDGGDEAKHHQREIVGRVELLGNGRKRRRECADEQVCRRSPQRMSRAPRRPAPRRRVPASPSDDRRYTSRWTTLHPAC